VSDTELEEKTTDDGTILDVIARALHAMWVAVGHAGRRFGAWLKKRGRIVWVERDILQLRQRRTEALVALGESVYKTFRDEASGRPELMAQVDQVQELEMTLARKQRLRERIEREGIA
jgi:hypothetical protein